MAPLRPLTALLLAASLLTGCVMFEQAPAPLTCDPDLLGRWIPLPDSPQDRVPLGKDDPAQLRYGQSITDACIGWDDSLGVLQTLSDAVQARRKG